MADRPARSQPRCFNASASRHAGPRGDHLGQGVAQGAQPLRILDRLVVFALDVEGVDRDAALGADPGEGDVESVVGDRLGEPVEEASWSRACTSTIVRCMESSW